MTDLPAVLLERWQKSGAADHFAALFISKSLDALVDGEPPQAEGAITSTDRMAAAIVLQYLRRHGCTLSAQSLTTEAAALFDEESPNVDSELKLSHATRPLKSILTIRRNERLRANRISNYKRSSLLNSPRPETEFSVHLTQEFEYLPPEPEVVLPRTAVTVTVLVVSGEGFAFKADLLASLDLFCELKLEGSDQVFKTRLIEESSHEPEWNEKFVFNFVSDEKAVLEFTVFDHDEKGIDQTCASLILPFPIEAGEVDGWHPLTPTTELKSVASVRLVLTTTVVPLDDE
jgi:hypothetical protein